MLIRRYTRRYRNALLGKLGVLALLGLGILGVAAWRLSQWRVSPVFSVGLPAVLALAVIATLAWSLRRHWAFRRGGAAHLDRALGLEQRLVTAEEFAHAPQQPALYPLLVEDALVRCALERSRFPKPLTRTSGLLALILLLLLCWPRPGVGPLHLAQLPQPVLPHPPRETPAPPQDSREDRRQQGGSSSESSPSAGGGEQPQSSGDRSSSESSRGEGRQDKSDAKPQDQGERRDGTEAQGGEAAQQQARDQRGDGRDQERSDDERAARSGERSGDGREAPASRGEHPAQAAARREQGGGGEGQSPGDQQALKAEIQELLKEVSGELKELQAQLEAVAQQQSPPEPGTSSDPDLYESAMALERPQGPALPIQLPADTAQTASRRPGGGVGRPSGEVSRSLPQTKPEDAQLSDQPLEERSSARQTIPPEYRGVFERLRGARTSPSATP